MWQTEIQILEIEVTKAALVSKSQFILDLLKSILAKTR
jgi:hypothetical protein